MRQQVQRSWFDRLLAAVGEDDHELRSTKIEVFRRFVMLAIAGEYWNELLATPSGNRAFETAVVGLFSACAAFVWVRGWARAATTLGAVLALANISLHFPVVANHHYVQLTCLLLLSFFNPKIEAETDLLLKSLQWLTIIGVFYAGVQKFLWGHYFHGEFLAFLASGMPRFSEYFRLLMPADEFARIARIDLTNYAGETYRVDSLWFAVVSNASYLAEIALPPLLLHRRTRTIAVVGLLAYFVAIEIPAREIYFGGIIAQLTLLFWPGDLNRRLQPAFVVAYAFLFAMSVGVLPKWFFFT